MDPLRSLGLSGGGYTWMTSRSDVGVDLGEIIRKPKEKFERRNTLTVNTSQSLEYCRIIVEATRDIQRVQLSPALRVVKRNVERNVI